MAEDDLDDEIDVEAEAVAEAARSAEAGSKGKIGRTTYIMAAAALVIGVLGGGAGGYMVAGASAPSDHHEAAVAADHHGEEAAKAEPEVQTPTIFVDLPKVHTNIATGRCRGLYINLQVTAGVGSPEEAEALRTASGFIKDGLTEYARSVTKAQLEGREGSERLRANVDAIVKSTAPNVRVRDILFKEYLLQ